MPLPKPDYGREVAQVYCATVKAIIQHTADLSVLCVPKDFGGLFSEHKIPSWVPNWAAVPDETLSFWTPHEMLGVESDTFAAAGDTLPKGPDFNFEQEAGSAPRKKKRPSQPSNLMQLVPDGRQNCGLVERIFTTEPDEPAHSDVRLLDLSGFTVDSVIHTSAPIPKAAFDNNTWKQHILQWEKMIRAFKVFARYGSEVREIDPGPRHPKLGSFLLAIMRGKLFLGPGMNAETLTETYVEHYLVWSGRLNLSEARVPILSAVLGMFFDHELKKSVRGWKFAITREQRMALVPAAASNGNAIVVLFGADFPLLVHPFCKMPYNAELRVCWTLLGSTFVENIMGGEALEAARKKGREEERFLFM
jgi:hypothetical protein